MSRTVTEHPPRSCPPSPGTFPVPAIIADAGEKASEHFLEFFAATIRNKNTRAAYVQAVAQFCRWCEEYQLQLATIRPLHVSAYIESKPLTAPSVKQHLAALRGLFNWLVIKQVVPDNPALFVKGPRFSRQIGITPILEPDQMRKLLDSIPVTREVKIAKKHGGGVRIEADVKGPARPGGHRHHGLYLCARERGAETQARRLHAAGQARPPAPPGKRQQGKARLAAP